MADLVQRILDLRKRVDQATDLRGKASTALEVAKQRLADVDARLKEHNINPEQCEQELAALEQSLDQHVTEFDAKLTEEIAAYNRILAAASAADAAESR
jgi:chromosome segregation ATPase